jgi:glycosyltransferase involved in cell wall biosynthesis
MVGKLPKVTVLISTYNRPDYLKDAIASVVNQRFKDWELLVMNDGGVNVDYVVDDFQDSRIRYFQDEENRRLPFRLNFGLRQARGEYIAYLGDDDIYYPNHLEVLTKAMDENPDVGVVYSDLYAVQFIKDEVNGKRYPLHKFIQVSRDYNRDYMFCYNHTLHVSLLHRKDLALKVGGYDESVTVLVDWNITRKLSFYTDFKYIQQLTGEYYMPIGKSDRISNLEREDNERYKHNLRKIKADLPPEPWPKVDKIAVIFPVFQWTEAFRATVTGLIDHLCYPVKFVLINNDHTSSESACRKALGKIGELKNIFICTPPKRLSMLEAYRFGAENVNAEYVYLPSTRADTTVHVRLIEARNYLKNKPCEGIKWDIAQEKNGPFDILMAKEVFLIRTDPVKGSMGATIDVIPRIPTESLRFDFFLSYAEKHFKEGNYDIAYNFLGEAEAVKKGGSADQYLIDLYAKICFDMKKYDEAEEKCRILITRGYGADNWIRLGRTLQTKGEYAEAIEAYQSGLKEIGLQECVLGSPVFPIIVQEDFGAFTALIGMGECLLLMGNLTGAAKMIHKASKLKANSHRTFLGFGKLFLATNEYQRAEEALLAAKKLDEKDPVPCLLLGQLYEKKQNLATAFSYFQSAFERDKSNADTIDSVYHAGFTLGKWVDLKNILEEFLECRPGYIKAMRYLATVYRKLHAHQKAEELIDKARAFDCENGELQDSSLGICQANEPGGVETDLA